MKWLKENWEPLIGVILVFALLIFNIGGFLSGFFTHSLNYWDIGALVLILLLLAYGTFTVKTR